MQVKKDVDDVKLLPFTWLSYSARISLSFLLLLEFDMMEVSIIDQVTRRRQLQKIKNKKSCFISLRVHRPRLHPHTC